MNNYIEHIRNQIDRNNPWYTASQFAWAEKEQVKRIYHQRLLYFSKIIKEEILKKGRITLLDYGCGDGYWSLVFSQFASCKVTGVDYNPLRLENARSIVKNATFLEADLRNKNQQIGKFDIVFCSQVIEHIEDDFLLLNNIRKNLKKDGILILGTTNEGCFTQRHIFRRHLLKESDHIHFYIEKEIKTKIEKAGFVIKDIYREVFYPGSDKLFYKLTSTDFGFRLLELLTILFPSQCSDYYFECKKKQ